MRKNQSLLSAGTGESGGSAPFYKGTETVYLVGELAEKRMLSEGLSDDLKTVKFLNRKPYSEINSSILAIAYILFVW